MIVSITQDKQAMVREIWSKAEVFNSFEILIVWIWILKVTTNDDKRHGLVDGDYVTFKEVQGMEEVNN